MSIICFFGVPVLSFPSQNQSHPAVGVAVVGFSNNLHVRLSSSSEELPPVSLIFIF